MSAVLNLVILFLRTGRMLARFTVANALYGKFSINADIGTLLEPVESVHHHSNHNDNLQTDNQRDPGMLSD